MNQLFSQIYSSLPANIKNYWRKIYQSEIGKRVADGAFWSVFGSIISRGLMLFASIVVARILGKTEYGELGMIRSTVNMFTVFASFGLGLTATKYIAEYRESNKAKAGRIIGLSTLFAGVSGSILALIILFFAPYVATNTINAPYLTAELRLGAVILFFSALNGAQTGILAGYEAFKTIAKISLLSGLVAFPIQIGFTLLWGLTGSVIGFGVNFLFLWLLSYHAVRKESKKFKVHICFKSSWQERNILYKFSLPALLSGLLISPVIWACNTMLVNQPNGYNEMAIFDAANQWRILVLFIPSSLGQIVLPLLTNILETNKKSNYYQKMLKINILVNISVVSFTILPIILLPNFILGFYGKDFTGNQSVLIILILSAIFSSICHVIGQAIASTGKMWHGFLFNIIWAVIILLSSYMLILRGLGALALSISFLISYIALSFLQLVYMKKFLQKSSNISAS